jgi:hypothetical protein
MVKANKWSSSALLAVPFLLAVACDKAPNVGAMHMAVEEDSNSHQDSDPVVVTNAANQPAPKSDSGTAEKPSEPTNGTKEVSIKSHVAAFEDWFQGNVETNRYRDAIYYGKGAFRAVVDRDGHGKLYWAGAKGRLTLLHVRSSSPACSHKHEVLSVKPGGAIRTKVAYSSSQKSYEQKFYPAVDVEPGDELRIRLAPQDWCKSKLPPGVTWLELSDSYAVIMKVD